MNPRRPLIAANWKMNLDATQATAWWNDFQPHLEALSSVDLVVAPTALVLPGLAQQAADSALAVYGQNIHAKPAGAYTGEISAPLLQAAGASGVLIGHSERRQYFGETDDTVRRKAVAASSAGLPFILCVGESETDRVEGNSLAVVRGQLTTALADLESVEGLTVAYEPVWAIGTGRRAETGQIAEMHTDIREQLSGQFADNGDLVRILYGGSVKPDTATEVFSIDNVDGALVGGASLHADAFAAIARAALLTAS